MPIAVQNNSLIRQNSDLVLNGSHRVIFIRRHHATERQYCAPAYPSEPVYMDLNYLYERYAVSLQMSKNAACDSSRIVHRKLAEAYASQIAQVRIRGSLSPA